MTIKPAPPERVLVAGASVRAAVQSAQRGGAAQVIAADLFQDRDLAAAIRCPLTAGYRNLPSAALRLRPDAWLYTGALENHPELVEAVPATLLGNSAPALRNVRDPWEVAAALQRAGFATLGLARHGHDLPRDGGWLQKRLASAAGRDLVLVDHSFSATTAAAVYYQQRAMGVPTSAVFVAADGESRLLGVTRQRIGVGDPRAGAFQYLGSSGPLHLSSALQNQWHGIGAALARRFSLQGLFGVDAIVTRDRISVVEVNPRYTASVEVLERAGGWNAWQIHWQACGQATLPPPHASPQSFAAKRILFAERDIWVSDSFLAWAEAENASREWPVMADLPAAAGLVPRGAPLLTVLAGPLGLHAAVQVELRRHGVRVRAALQAVAARAAPDE